MKTQDWINKFNDRYAELDKSYKRGKFESRYNDSPATEFLDMVHLKTEPVSAAEYWYNYQRECA